MFNTKIVREQGGSELHIFSGGSVVLDAGAALTQSGLESFAAGASLNIAAGPSVTVLSFTTGASAPGIYAGFDVPSFKANMGSLYIRSQGSISGLWVNITQDAAGSSWRAFQQGSAIG
jgi:hypothetical protein